MLLAADYITRPLRECEFSNAPHIAHRRVSGGGCTGAPIRLFCPNATAKSAAAELAARPKSMYVRRWPQQYFLIPLQMHAAPWSMAPPGRIGGPYGNPISFAYCDCIICYIA